MNIYNEIMEVGFQLGYDCRHSETITNLCVLVVKNIITLDEAKEIVKCINFK